MKNIYHAFLFLLYFPVTCVALYVDINVFARLLPVAPMHRKIYADSGAIYFSFFCPHCLNIN
jgi:hypothetical protein